MVKYHVQRIFALKFAALKQTVSRKYRRSFFVSSEFSSKSPKKPGNSSKLVCITFKQYCMYMWYKTHFCSKICSFHFSEKRGNCVGPLTPVHLTNVILYNAEEAVSLTTVYDQNSDVEVCSCIESQTNSPSLDETQSFDGHDLYTVYVGNEQRRFIMC